jgi:hypothetical protein
MSMDNHGGMVSTGATPDSSIRALWKSYQQSSNSKSRGTTKKIMNLAFKVSLFILRSGFYVVKSYTGQTALLPIRKEGVLRIFIAFKNPSPRPGLKPRTLGPTVRTITTRPPRKLTWNFFLIACYHADQNKHSKNSRNVSESC